MRRRNGTYSTGTQIRNRSNCEPFPHHCFSWARADLSNNTEQRKEKLLKVAFVLPYSFAVGWCRMMCMIRPGGYKGRCSVRAMELSLGWVVAFRAEVRCCRNKCIHSVLLLVSHRKTNSALSTTTAPSVIAQEEVSAVL